MARRPRRRTPTSRGIAGTSSISSAPTSLEMVTAGSVEEFLSEWLGVGIAWGEWQLEAVRRAPSQSWAITVTGAEATAARKAQRALSALKTPRGAWRRLEARRTTVVFLHLPVSARASRPCRGALMPCWCRRCPRR